MIAKLWRLARAIPLLAPLSAFATPHINSIEPAQIPYGQAHDISLQVSGWTPSAQIALTPGAPYISSYAVTPTPLHAIVALPDLSLVAVSDADLTAYHNATLKPLWTAKFARNSAQRRARAWNNGILITQGNLLLYAKDRVVSSTPIYSGASVLRDVDANDQRIFVLEDHRLVVLDAAAATRGRVLGTYSVSDDAQRLRVDHDHCFLVAPKSGHVLDCAAATPRAIAEFRTSGEMYDIAIGNGTLLIADGAQGMSVIDIADPTQPRLVGSNNKLGDVRRIVADGERALVANQNSELIVLDLTRRELPMIVSKLHVPALPNEIYFSEDAAYVTSAHGIQRIDFSADAPPAISDEGVNLGGSRRGFIKDKTLYVADWFSGLHIYDISHPEHLRHLGNFHTAGSSKGVVVRDDIAFVGDDDHGVQFINIKDPAHPFRVGEVATPGLAYTMKLVGNLLYLADHRGGIHIIDVSDVTQAHIVGSYLTPSKAWAVDVRDHFAFVADDAAGLLVIDVTNPAAPTPVGQFAPGGQAEDVRLRDHYALVTFFDQGLFVLDIADPTQPKLIAQLPIPGNARGIDVQGDIAFVAAWESGLHIIDIHDLSQPRELSYYDTDGSSWGVNVQGDFAYVLDWWGGVKALNVRDPAHPKFTDRYHAREPVRDIALGERYGYFASGASGVHIFDLKNPLNPVWVTGVEVPGNSNAVAVVGSSVIALTDTGIAVIDTSNPFQAQLQQFIERTDLRAPLRSDAERAWLLDVHGNVWTIDARGHLKRWTDAVRDVVDLWRDGTTLYCITRDRSLLAFDVNTPEHPTLNTKLVDTVRWIRANGNVLVTAAPGQGVRIFSRDTKGLREVARIDSTEKYHDMLLTSDTLFLTTEHSGFEVIDLHELTRPVVKYFYSAAAPLTRFALQNNTVFFAGATKPSSLTLLPTITATPRDAHSVSVTLPAQLPLGVYGLAVYDHTRRVQNLPNALHVKIRTGKKPSLTPDEFKTLLDQQRLTRPAN